MNTEFVYLQCVFSVKNTSLLGVDKVYICNCLYVVYLYVHVYMYGFFMYTLYLFAHDRFEKPVVKKSNSKQFDIANVDVLETEE